MIDAQGGAEARRSGPAAGYGQGARGGGARRERREQTRAALLEAAERLWAERGIHGVSLDDIAASAGLTKGAVYSNFEGKTDLLMALLQQHTDDRFGTEICTELRDTERPADDRFQRAGQAYARRLSGDSARLLALLLVEFWLYGMRDYSAGWRIADWYDERRAHLARCLEDAADVPASDRATLAMALDYGLAFQHLLDPARVSAELYSTGMRLILDEAVFQESRPTASPGGSA